MELDSVAMESFGAEPNTPVHVCKQHVAEADLVVLVLAHRYGWIPKTDQGGDGESSITRLEFVLAQSLRKPVLAFLVHPDAEWTSPRQQDELLHAASPEDATRVWRSVKLLELFKTEVGNGLVRDTFSTPADLADKVGTAVAKWLLQRMAGFERQASTRQELQDLFEKVADKLQQGLHDLALAYLAAATSDADPVHLGAIADKRLEIATAHLSLHDEELLAAADAVLVHGGLQRTLAYLYVGKVKSYLARVKWNEGKEAEAWHVAEDARVAFEEATRLEGLSPDAFGSLGGLLKRMAAWAAKLFPERVTSLEDAMLAAYRSGWEKVSDAYPLLNYIEQRAVLRRRREPDSVYPLLGDDETDLRIALGRALKVRENQLKSRHDRPWAAFDLARGRHYLNPNVPGFLEDLAYALEEARSLARSPSDRSMVTTTCDSLSALLEANVKLEGLQEGLLFLRSAVEHNEWYLERPQLPERYLERELQQLQAALSEYSLQQLRMLARSEDQLTNFIAAAELRWSREDEEHFQAEAAQWKLSLEPMQYKIVRGLWKVFGSKGLELITGGIPVDWNEVAALIGKTIRK
jgi:hypothetical protein